MEFMRVIVTSLLFSSCLTIFFMCLHALKKKPVSGRSADFLVLCGVCVAIYDIGYAMEINSTTLDEVMRWVRFEHIGIQPLSILWLIFTFHIMGIWNSVSRPIRVLLCLPPLAMFVASQTLGSLNLLHPNPRLQSCGTISIFMYDRTWTMYLATAVHSLYLMISSLIFTGGFIYHIPVPRKQAFIYWIGSILPWISCLAYIFGLTPYGLDTTPFALSLSVMLFAAGFLKIGMLDIAPLARDVIFEGASDGFLVVDHKGRITDSNSAMRRIMPALEGIRIGAPAAKVFSGFPAVVRLLEEKAAGAIEFVEEAVDKHRAFQVTSTMLKSERGKNQGTLLNFHDVTEMKILQDNLKYLAIHDDLTGLYNRRFLNEAVPCEIERVHRYGGDLSIVLLDLDYFKNINDSYGHAAGDIVLKRVAETCRSRLRACDVTGRFGGEEILVLLPETNLGEAVAVAEKLRRAIELLCVECEGNEIALTASFGVATLGAAANTFKQLIMSADKAMYRAKETGRNRVCVYAEASEAGAMEQGS